MPVDAPVSRRDWVEMDVRARPVYVSLTPDLRPDDVARTIPAGRTVDGHDVFLAVDENRRILAIGVA